MRPLNSIVDRGVRSRVKRACHREANESDMTFDTCAGSRIARECLYDAITKDVNPTG
jgi:hypothetical protein